MASSTLALVTRCRVGGGMGLSCVSHPGPRRGVYQPTRGVLLGLACLGRRRSHGESRVGSFLLSTRAVVVDRAARIFFHLVKGGADMPGKQGSNGASKRMSNPKRKENRAKSWARAERRKDARRKADEARHAENVAWLNGHGMHEYLPAEYVGGVRVAKRKRASKLVRIAKREAARRAA